MKQIKDFINERKVDNVEDIKNYRKKVTLPCTIKEYINNREKYDQDYVDTDRTYGNKYLNLTKLCKGAVGSKSVLGSTFDMIFSNKQSINIYVDPQEISVRISHENNKKMENEGTIYHWATEEKIKKRKNSSLEGPQLPLVGPDYKIKNAKELENLIIDYIKRNLKNL